MIARVRGVIAACCGVKVDQPGAGHGVDQDRGGARVFDRIRGGDECHRGDEHLVPGPMPSTSIERIRAAVHDETQRHCGTPT